MASASASTVTPLSQSIFFKSQIFRHNLQLWKTTTTKNVSGIPATRRRPRVRLLLLSPHLRLPHPSLQIRHRNLLYLPSLRLLLRTRSPHRPTRMSSLADSNTNTNTNANSKTVRVVVKGRVQGVFYRNWTIENAKELGLKGWVRNRRDGSVEALFSGTSDKVQEMEQRCRRGPPAAMVTGLEVFPCSDDPGTGFERRSTV